MWFPMDRVQPIQTFTCDPVRVPAFQAHGAKCGLEKRLRRRRISVHNGRMTLATTDGVVNTSFSLNEASTPHGVCVSLGPERGNRYTILGPLKFLEHKIRQGRIFTLLSGVAWAAAAALHRRHYRAGSLRQPCSRHPFAGCHRSRRRRWKASPHYG